MTTAQDTLHQERNDHGLDYGKSSAVAVRPVTYRLQWQAASKSGASQTAFYMRGPKLSNLRRPVIFADLARFPDLLLISTKGQNVLAASHNENTEAAGSCLPRTCRGQQSKCIVGSQRRIEIVKGPARGVLSAESRSEHRFSDHFFHMAAWQWRQLVGP